MKVMNHQRWMIPNVTSQFDKEFDLLDVLVEDCAGTFAVYRAIVDYPEKPSTDFLCQWVAAQGAKLRFEDAKCSFPFLTEEVYRS